MEEDITELIKNLPCDVIFLPQKKEPLETFVVGSSKEVFNPVSENWFMFFTNDKTRKSYEETAISIIDEALSTLIPQ